MVTQTHAEAIPDGLDDRTGEGCIIIPDDAPTADILALFALLAACGWSEVDESEDLPEDVDLADGRFGTKVWMRKSSN